MKLALKVDVDTYEGMQKGVPNFLKLFKEQNIQVSFFIPFGPDESGKAIFRIFKKKGFLKKMIRTNPVKLYGPKTMLRGTLLPAPMIGSSFPSIAQDVLQHGHELGIHGYNHVLWQDHLLEMNEEQVKEQFELGISAYERAIGIQPKSFAAPAWLCSMFSLKMLDQFQFDYASDSRGYQPFYPTMNGTHFKTIQVPSTLPTTDELLGVAGLNNHNVHNYLSQQIELTKNQLHVHTIHTEVEGLAMFNDFADWIRNLKKNDCEFVRLDQQVQSLLKEQSKISVNEIILDELPGRAGKVACQKK